MGTFIIIVMLAFGLALLIREYFLQTRHIGKGIRLKDVSYNPGEPEEEELEDFPEIYTDRSEAEFQLGLALFFMVNMEEEPEEYVDMDLMEIEDTVQAALAYWKLKYDNETHWSNSSVKQEDAE